MPGPKLGSGTGDFLHVVRPSFSPSWQGHGMRLVCKEEWGSATVSLEERTCPHQFFPKPNTLPSLRRTSECTPPQATWAATAVPSLTTVGLGESFVLPVHFSN